MARIKRDRPETEKGTGKEANREAGNAQDSSRNAAPLQANRKEAMLKLDAQAAPENAADSKYLIRQIERDIYTEAGIYDFCDSDEISDIEQGFMHGYIVAAA
jgi:hypothetical protein